MYVNRVNSCIYFYRKLNNNHKNINLLKNSKLNLLRLSFTRFPVFLSILSHKKDKYLR